MKELYPSGGGLPACPSCLAPGSTVLVRGLPDRFHRGPRYRIARCRTCGLAFTDPAADSYPPEYEPFKGRSESPPRERGTRAAVLRAYYRGNRSLLERALLLLPYLVFAARDRMKVRARDHYARPFRRRGRLLDVGCGAGETLKAWLRQHERCVAVEPDPGAAEAARRTLGIEVRTGRLEEQAFAPASFDAITLSHVLEHAVDPRAVLARAAQWLVPGGEILVWVPNFGSLFRPLFGAGWFPYEVPRHRWHFRPEDLARLLREAGLALVEVAPDPNEHPFRASARRSSPPLSFILRRRAVRILCLLIGRLFRRSDVLRFRAIKPAPHGPASALASERSTSAAARSQL